MTAGLPSLSNLQRFPPQAEWLCSIQSEVVTRAVTRYNVGKLAYGGVANKYVAAEQQTQSVPYSVTFSTVFSIVFLYHLSGLQPQKNFTWYTHVHIYMPISTRDTGILI